MFNFSSRIYNLIAYLNGEDRKKFWIEDLVNNITNEKENGDKDEIIKKIERTTIKKRYYTKQRINQILLSLNKNIKKEIKILKRNLEIVKRNIEVIEKDLRILEEIEKEINYKENKTKIEDLKLFFKILEKLSKEKSVKILNIYIQFSEELLNKKENIEKFKPFLEKDLKSEDLIFILKELYLNFRVLEDFYFSFKTELSKKIEKINNEIFIIEKKIEERIEELIKKEKKNTKIRNLKINLKKFKK